MKASPIMMHLTLLDLAGLVALGQQALVALAGLEVPQRCCSAQVVLAVPEDLEDLGPPLAALSGILVLWGILVLCAALWGILMSWGILVLCAAPWGILMLCILVLCILVLCISVLLCILVLCISVLLCMLTPSLPPGTAPCQLLHHPCSCVLVFPRMQPLAFGQ